MSPTPRFNHLYLVTHTDLDGIASAAIAARKLGRSEEGYSVLFAEPYNVDQVIAGLEEHLSKGDLVVVSDLGVNRDSFQGLLEALRGLTGVGAYVKWFDHHIWSEEERNALLDLGVELHVDTSTCAAGVVAKYLEGPVDDFVEKLVDAVCSADLWRWTNPLSGKLFRIVGERSQSWEWKERLVGKFASGVIWDNELDARLEEYVTQELEGYNRVLSTVASRRANGYLVVAAYKYFRGPPSSSMIGALLLSRYNADIALILRNDGGLSLRSRRVNVQVVARALGGGGHPRASGAKLKMPLLVRIGSKIYPKLASIYASQTVSKIVSRLGREVEVVVASARSAI
ncbi:MAG: DHHA1 domain-containing protein [Aeropyrum sp.]|nr:DHHA1 domain-containing protein [Aeropyrum sp.]MCE4615960.1 DHHA1 domain-containing protein [Aeropyrum sp.]